MSLTLNSGQRGLIRSPPAPVTRFCTATWCSVPWRQSSGSIGTEEITARVWITNNQQRSPNVTHSPIQHQHPLLSTTLTCSAERRAEKTGICSRAAAFVLSTVIKDPAIPAVLSQLWDAARQSWAPHHELSADSALRSHSENNHEAQLTTHKAPRILVYF